MDIRLRFNEITEPLTIHGNSIHYEHLVCEALEEKRKKHEQENR